MGSPLVSLETRRHIVNMLRAGSSYEETAQALGVGRATVNRVWRVYRETGEVRKAVRKGGRSPIIPDSMDGEFTAMVKSMADATYDELTVAWRRISKTKLSRAAVIRKVIKLGFSLKKKKLVAKEKKTPRNAAKRASFRFRRKNLPLEKLVFLDESGFQGHLRRSHARALIGETATSFVSSWPSPNITVTGAIRLSGRVCLSGSRNSMTTKRFLSFLRQKLLPRLAPGDILVMDNLRAHRNKAIRLLCRKWDVRVFYLPPYSPEYNPIETVWSWMKRRLRKRVNRCKSAFRYAISGAWRKASCLDFSALFRSCGWLGPCQTI